MTYTCKHISIAINRPVEDVYQFASFQGLFFESGGSDWTSLEFGAVGSIR